eukprot:5209249-Pleurochrysis_carterae.AAC.1
MGSAAGVHLGAISTIRSTSWIESGRQMKQIGSIKMESKTSEGWKSRRSERGEGKGCKAAPRLLSIAEELAADALVVAEMEVHADSLSTTGGGVAPGGGREVGCE